MEEAKNIVDAAIKEYKKEYAKRDYVKKRERLRGIARNHNRRKNGIKEVKVTTIRKVIETYNNKCYWCGCKINTEKPKSLIKSLTFLCCVLFLAP